MRVLRDVAMKLTLFVFWPFVAASLLVAGAAVLVVVWFMIPWATFKKTEEGWKWRFWVDNE